MPFPMASARGRNNLVVSVGGFDPSSISGLKLWLKADAIVGLSDGDPVATWADSSGQGNDAAQETASKKPTYKTNILNSKPVVRFDGVDDELSLGNLSASFPSAATLFIVARLNSDTEWSLYLAGTNNNRWRYSDTQGYIGVFRVSRIAGYPPSMPSSGSFIFTVRSSSSDYGVYQNGSLLGSLQSADHEGGNNHTIGNSVGDYLDGDIAEIIAYNSALSTTDRQNVENYLNQKYTIY